MATSSPVKISFSQRKLQPPPVVNKEIPEGKIRVNLISEDGTEKRSELIDLPTNGERDEFYNWLMETKYKGFYILIEDRETHSNSRFSNVQH